MLSIKDKLSDFYWNYDFEIKCTWIPIAIITTLIGVLIYFAVRNSDITAGYVVNKNYSAPWVQTIPVTIGNVTTIQTIYHSECYGITLEDRTEEEPKQFSMCVNKSIYDATKIGSFIDLKGETE